MTVNTNQSWNLTKLTFRTGQKTVIKSRQMTDNWKKIFAKVNSQHSLYLYSDNYRYLNSCMRWDMSTTTFLAEELDASGWDPSSDEDGTKDDSLFCEDGSDWDVKTSSLDIFKCLYENNKTTNFYFFIFFLGWKFVYFLPSSAGNFSLTRFTEIIFFNNDPKLQLTFGGPAVNHKE